MTGGGIQSELTRILAPHSLEEFRAQHYEREPLFVGTADPHRLDGLLDGAGLFRILAHGCVSRQDARAVRDGAVDPDRALFDADGYASPLGMAGAFADGCTIVLNNVQRRLPAVAALVRAFELGFGQPAGANAYLTPPGATGLAPHFDDHDVFVLQLEGTKRWRVHSPACDLPLRGRHFEIDPATVGEPLGEWLLSPGSLLYLPRGFIHSAEARAEASLHLTFGLSCFRRLDVVQEAAALWAQVEHDARRAAAFTAGDAPAAGNAPDLHHMMDAAHRNVQLRFLQTMAPLEDCGFNFARNAEALSPNSRVRHRAGTLCITVAGHEDAQLHFPGNVLVCPLRSIEALEFVGRTPAFRVCDIPGLDEGSALLLARKLMVSGLLVPDEGRD